MEAPDPAALAAAFVLDGSPDALEPTGTFNDTWRMRAGDSTYLVKVVRRDEPDWWRAHVARAQTFERRAHEAGMPFPQPVVPIEPEIGYIARVEGALIRISRWIHGRPLGPSDDVADWLGTTMARLHEIEPSPDVDRWIYGLHDPEQWQAWADEGASTNKTWAPLLGEGMETILECLRWVGDSLDAASNFVMTHRDVEPWNVIVTRDGPMLVDLEGCGPDSATLELAHAALSFAQRSGTEPDADAMRRTVQAYRAAGGPPLPTGRAGLARRVGMKLNRLAWNLMLSLGQRPAHPGRERQAEGAALGSLEELPSILDRIDDWARSLAG